MSTAIVSATGIQDTSGQVFAFGTWQLVFKPTFGFPGPFTDGGVSFTKLYGGSLDATGSFSQSNINRNDTIAPANSRWTLIVSPNASSQAFQIDLNVNSANVDATAAINAAISLISFAATPIAHGYKDNEIILIPNSGGMYYNNTDKSLRIWDTANNAFSTFLPTTGEVVLNPTASQNINQPTGTQLTVPRFNNHIYVDGIKYPITQAGIQQAFTDACAISNGAGAGVHVWLPPCAVALNNLPVTGATEQFLITAPIQIHGSGPNSTWFILGTDPTIDNIPVFRVKPSVSDEGYYHFDNFRITSGGAHGGDGFFLEASATTTINRLLIDCVEVVGLANGSWAMNMNTAGGSERFILNKIRDCNLSHGIKLTTSSVDSWMFEHNSFGAFNNNPVTTPCFDITSGSGASHITFFNNNGGLPGGIAVIHAAIEPQFICNQFEQGSLVSVEANSAMIDLMGDVSPIDHPVLFGNNLGSSNNCNINVRVDHVTRAYLSANVYGVNTAGGIGVVLTANSSGTVMDVNNSNEFILGGTAVAMTNASGVNPWACTLYSPTGTVPCTIRDDGAGGFQIITNASKSWDFQNTSNLIVPAGIGITYQGATSGTATVNPPAVAGGTHLWPVNGGTLNETTGNLDQTALAAAIAATILNTGTLIAGQYLVVWDAKITQAATTSSTLGPATISWTDPDGTVITTVVSATQPAGGITVSGIATNTVNAFLLGTPLPVNVKAGANVTIAFAYASSGATPMQYNFHARLVAL